MCGIAGFVTNRPLVLEETIQHMADRLLHRGPDDSGCWVDTEVGLALGHRRLSILDLSPNGHQPMMSACGRYVIVLNGEIYNHEVLRRTLDTASAAPGWRGHSDTEVLLAAISRWGLERALDESVGMFAFALWDRQARTLFLARDRFGEKPLYYGSIGSSFVFGSELKALTAFPQADPEIDRQALAAMLQFGYVPSPWSIYRGIGKLPAGSVLAVHVGAGGQPNIGDPRRYWTIDDDSSRLRNELADADEESLADSLDLLLRQAVRAQMSADVPLGAFLSGGIDSSLVVALMQSESTRPVQTFTIGFREDGYDEAPFAKAVARHLGTAHTEWYISSAEAADIIPELPRIFDEPFADSSQIPTTLVARMTRQRVTVSLSGDGGDELFGGYPRYSFAQTLWRRFGSLPGWSRRSIATVAAGLSPRSWDRLLQVTTPARFRQSINGHRIHRLATLIDADSFEDMYVRLLSQWPADCGLVLGDGARPHVPVSVQSNGQPYLDRMRRWDIACYLPDDILVKVDRAAMSVSLETRAPLLDHRVARFAWALPAHALVRNGRGKWLLRRLLDRYVPPALIERPKAGFGMPVARWLRTDLREWAEALLDERKLRKQGLLAPEQVRRMWREHLAGTHDHQSRLWSVLMFQAWLEAQGTATHHAPSGHAAAPAM
ncbi:MAG: asparagine synthase (glutamine-hydrolyzing) [Burkholderiales bacterium]|nr:asparagine synthase (glutamine-hydrolyzing) [Burkholderiales bacterium]OJX04178.1 MAG: asparagine synthase (glutamine-hydrolyzing) [Burkholderiales bacterium 70-64]